MSVIDEVLRRHGNGLDRAVGARIYEDEHGIELVSLVTPEEEAIQFLLDGLGVATIHELHRLVERGRGPVLERTTLLPPKGDSVFGIAPGEHYTTVYRIRDERDGWVEDVVCSTVTKYAIGAEPE